MTISSDAADMQDLGGIGEALEGLGDALSDAGVSATALQRALTDELSDALKALIVDGASASDVLDQLAKSMADMLVDTVLTPASQSFGDWVTDTILGAGNSVLGGTGDGGGSSFLSTAANTALSGLTSMFGGDTATGSAGLFGMSNQASANGGASGYSASPVNVTIQTSNVDSFRRSQSQVAAQLARAVDRGRSYL